MSEHETDTDTSTEVEYLEPGGGQPVIRSLLPSASETERLTKAATLLADTEFVPSSLRGKWPAVLAAMLSGREMGIGPMRALRQVNVVEGKPTPSAELMLALAMKAGHFVKVVETTNERCTVRVRRADWPEDEEPAELTWTLEDAYRAGLCQPGEDGMPRARSRQGSPLPWEQYPRAMLRSRAISEACRAWLPDAVEGYSYVPEELGAPVNGNGHAVELLEVDPDYDPLEGLPAELRQQVEEALAAAGEGPEEQPQVCSEHAVAGCPQCADEPEPEPERAPESEPAGGRMTAPGHEHEGGEAVPVAAHLETVAGWSTAGVGGHLRKHHDTTPVGGRTELLATHDELHRGGGGPSEQEGPSGEPSTAQQPPEEPPAGGSSGQGGAAGSGDLSGSTSQPAGGGVEAPEGELELCPRCSDPWPEDAEECGYCGWALDPFDGLTGADQEEAHREQQRTHARTRDPGGHAGEAHAAIADALCSEGDHRGPLDPTDTSGGARCRACGEEVPAGEPEAGCPECGADLEGYRGRTGDELARCPDCGWDESPDRRGPGEQWPQPSSEEEGNPGSWWLLSDGSRVQGEEAARAAQAELDRTEEPTGQHPVGSAVPDGLPEHDEDGEPLDEEAIAARSLLRARYRNASYVLGHLDGPGHSKLQAARSAALGWGDDSWYVRPAGQVERLVARAEAMAVEAGGGTCTAGHEPPRPAVPREDGDDRAGLCAGCAGGR